MTWNIFWGPTFVGLVLLYFAAIISVFKPSIFKSMQKHFKAHHVKNHRIYSVDIKSSGKPTNQPDHECRWYM